MLAVIGGSSLSQLAGLDVSHREVLRTPYGEPSGAITFGQMFGRPMAFLGRNGYGHTILPHEVNYRANLWALHERGAVGIISVASVGGIRVDLKPGDVVIPHQIIDYTWGRKSTYFEGQDRGVTHVDFTEPYDANLRQQLIEAAREVGVPMSDSAVYAVTQGPRLETAAEIDRLERDGADVVGMTAMPEAALARELGIPYASIGVVANHAAGRGASRHSISFESIQAVLQRSMGGVRNIIEKMVERDC